MGPNITIGFVFTLVVISFSPSARVTDCSKNKLSAVSITSFNLHVTILSHGTAAAMSGEPDIVTILVESATSTSNENEASFKPILAILPIFSNNCSPFESSSGNITFETK